MRKTSTLSLSTDAITEQILAIAALNGLQYRLDDDNIPMLTTDQRPALTMQVKSSFAFILLHMMPHVVSCNINEPATDDSDNLLLLELSLDTAATDMTALTVRTAIERAIVMDTLHACYLGHDTGMSDRYKALADESLTEVRRLIDTASATSAGRIMHWI